MVNPQNPSDQKSTYSAAPRLAKGILDDTSNSTDLTRTALKRSQRILTLRKPVDGERRPAPSVSPLFNDGSSPARPRPTPRGFARVARGEGKPDTRMAHGLVQGMVVEGERPKFTARGGLDGLWTVNVELPLGLTRRVDGFKSRQEARDWITRDSVAWLKRFEGGRHAH
jgi:hypothetical protein